jgi:pyruvate/2-oxoglutarate dehydrogenase complex dihydrolipoamide dehydrogenase (E3) component
MDHQYDIAILGGGAGGLFAASVANALGAKTCILEKIRLGGDCTWYGCMPSKAVLKSAHVAQLFRKSTDFGLTLPGDLQLGTDRVMSHVRDIVREIATHHEPEDLEKRGIKVIIGPPKFLDAKTVAVNGTQITAKRFILCTGSHPVVPPIEGLKEIDYLTNETIFNLNELPKSLTVLGGGPIGVELSQAMGRLGVKVSVVEMMDRILFREEQELGEVVERRLKTEGLDILTGHKAVKFSKKDGQVTVTLEDKQGRRRELFSDKVLVAVGRAPNIQGLDLERAGVECSNQGVKLNAYLQTTNPNIFACGDIASPYQFSHVAAYQAGICVRNALFRRLAWQKASYENVTWATFTDPELAHLGLTEDEARKKFGTIKVYKTNYTNVDRSFTDVETEGLVKVITDKKGLILGAHAVGAQAGEVMQGFLVAKSARIPLERIARTMFIYPTLSELVKKTAAKPLIEKGNNPAVKFLIKVLKSI